MVDIICDKLSESGDIENSSNANGSANPNMRGGTSTGTTKLTNSAKGSTNSSNQSCQCWLFFFIIFRVFKEAITSSCCD